MGNQKNFFETLVFLLIIKQRFLELNAALAGLLIGIIPLILLYAVAYATDVLIADQERDQIL